MRKKTYYSKQSRNEPITCNIMGSYTVITEYMKRHTKMSIENIHLLCYLATFPKHFNWHDIYEYPNGEGIRKAKNKIRDLLEEELINFYDPYHRDRDIREPYILTTKARNYVRLYNDLLLNIKTISWYASESDYEFITPLDKGGERKCRNNWYEAVKKFNKKVRNNIE